MRAPVQYMTIDIYMCKRILGACGARAATPAVGASLDGLAAFWRYSFAMPSIQVKDVPDEVHAILRRRAAAAGQSLQEYLLDRLTAETTMPTLDELLDRAGGRAGGRAPLAESVKAVRRDRDAR